MALNFKIFLKWTILVWLNAAYSFYMSLSKYSQAIEIAGITFVVFTFVIAYATVDIYPLNQNNLLLRWQLFGSVVIKMLFQIYPVIEMSSGIIAANIVEDLIGIISFLTAFLTTLIDGFLLSLLVAIIFWLVKFIADKLQTLNSVHQQ